MDYPHKTFLVLPHASSGVSFYSFTTAISTPVGTTSSGNSLLIPISNGTLNIFLKTIEREEKISIEMIALLVRSKLASNKKTISEVLIDSGTSYEE